MMKPKSIKILFAIIMMMAGITAQAANAITMTTSKKVGEGIYLRITANGNYTVSGANESSGSGYFFISSDNITITGDVTSLICYGDSLTSLDVSGDTLLTELFCYDNRLTSLDVSKCTKLKKLACDQNRLTSLDVSKCTKLINLDCNYNSLTKLDVGKCTELIWLYFKYNKLTELGLNNSNKLERIYCEGNNLDRGQMGGIVNKLADRTGTFEGEIVVFDTAGDNNKIFMTQVAAAKAKNWKVQSYDSKTDKYSDYEGMSAFTLTTKQAVGSVLSCGITLGSSPALLMKGATYAAPDSTHSDYLCTVGATTVKIDGDIKHLSCDHNSLTSLVTNTGVYSESISCLDNYLKGSAIDRLIASLPDRNSGTMAEGKLTVLQTGTDESGKAVIENNIITRKQVAAAKAKNWSVYAVNHLNSSTIVEEYAGVYPVISMGGTRKVGDEIRVDYTADGEDSISGAIIVTEPLSGAKYYTLSADTMKVAGVLTQFICSGNSLKWLKVSDNTALESLNCSNNAIAGANMDALIASLPDRIGRDAGTVVAINTNGDNNVCTTKQVVAAKAKNWNVKSVDNSGTLKDYTGSLLTGIERIADDGNAAIVAIYNVNGMKLAQPQPGLNILKMSNGTVKKIFLKE
jgi:Leucine-rich repeat (LRR) protein